MSLAANSRVRDLRKEAPMTQIWVKLAAAILLQGLREERGWGRAEGGPCKAGLTIPSNLREGLGRE
jgi:hypothetical protein